MQMRFLFSVARITYIIVQQYAGTGSKHPLKSVQTYNSHQAISTTYNKILNLSVDLIHKARSMNLIVFPSLENILSRDLLPQSQMRNKLIPESAKAPSHHTPRSAGHRYFLLTM